MEKSKSLEVEHPIPQPKSSDTSLINEESPIKLTRPEYYIQPALEDIKKLFNSNEVCRLEGGLTVGRYGYGSVFWKGPIDLKKPVDLDEIVHFRSKEVVVYPDETKKPEIGTGLNKPAEVSLERIWPIDTKTKQMIKVKFSSLSK